MDERDKEKEGEKQKKGRTFYSQAFATTDRTMAATGMWQAWAAGILGVWLALVPLFGLGDSTTTLVITGALVAITGFWTALTRGTWQAWAIGILGLWTVLVPYLDMASSTNNWLIVLTGLVVAVLGFWSALSRER